MRLNRLQLRGPSRGFALLLTLVLLVIAAMAAVSVCRIALSRVVAASEAQNDLQSRWGTLSCRIILLPKTEQILAAAEVQLKQSVVTTSKTIKLGNVTMELTFADESAKANVQSLILHQGKEQAALTIRRMSLDNPSLASAVYLRSSDPKLGPQSFGEVFDGTRPTPTDFLTCWGNGTLNIHRASETVLREVGIGILDLTQVRKLINLQSRSPQIALRDALNTLQLSQKNRTAAEQMLSDSSTCYSLWIRCESNRREDIALEVVDQSQPIWQYHHFQW